MRAPFVIAHRGDSAACPENTEAAVRKALEVGTPAVECDVQLTADGIPVVVHDPDLERLGGSNQPLASLLAKEVVGHQVQLPGERQPAAVVPTLEEWLDWIPSKVLAVVELKEQRDADRDRALAEQTAKLLAGRSGEAAVISFEDRLVEFVQQCWQDGFVGAIRNRPVSAEQVGSLIDQARGCVVLKKTVAELPWIRELNAAQLEVWSYALDEEDEIRDALERGVTGVISNRPGVALRVLGNH